MLTGENQKEIDGRMDELINQRQTIQQLVNELQSEYPQIDAIDGTIYTLGREHQRYREMAQDLEERISYLGNFSNKLSDYQYEYNLFYF